MPWLQANDDCKDGVEALSRVLAVVERRKASRIPVRQKLPEPPPIAEPESKPERESVIVAKPLRSNRGVEPGKLVNFLDFRTNGSAVFLVEGDTFVSLNLILVQTAKYFDISVELLRSERRFRQLTDARMVASYLAKKLTVFSYPEIGRRLCRDHSTVVHNVNRMKNIVAMRFEQSMHLINAAEIIEQRVLSS